MIGDGPPERLLRIADVSDRVGLARSMIYKLIAAGNFPQPYKVTSAAMRWREREVEDWINAVLEQRAGHERHAP